MIILTVKAIPKKEFWQLYLEEFGSLAKSVREEEGCLEYELFQQCETKPSLLLFERWESKELLEKHLASEKMNQFFSKIEGWFDEPVEMNEYLVTLNR
ncbi:putative quinol monooxygenase [Aureibacter tunicatorum]|uniref:Quinol monooxygenase YgiN n=1 Tax=Aureibacter tunicatorum TaxID=866807 RepID=A0AAE3XQJ2_9BACT|nr:putative quinol monooxygenase [Aureibacter tunicatorum]MDR6240757.1 quinol monooxygenase YgiN [Aureibacter tunicatorum]BDD06910.1 antibiotic biosynthesis monooxygenase [Aureibacter tunicatorum]